jgi:hypothetical protein
MPEAELDQAKYRRTQIAHDQFERPWAQVIEIKTGDPCGSNGHPFQWTDPLSTPQQYIKVPRDEAKRPMLGRIHIDFDQWIFDLKESYDDWKKFLFQIGKMRYKKTSPEEVAKWEDDAYLLEDAGPQPGAQLMHLAIEGETRPEQIIKRASEGDDTLLGVVGTREGHITWQSFLHEGTKAGRSVPEIQAAWAILKYDRAHAGKVPAGSVG